MIVVGSACHGRCRCGLVPISSCDSRFSPWIRAVPCPVIWCPVPAAPADHWYSAGLRCWSGRRGDAVVSARADWIRFRSVFSDSVRAARPLARPPARPVIRVPAVLTQMTAKLPRRNVIATASRISNTYGEGNRERTTYGRRTINCAAPSVPDTDLHACHAGSDGVPRIPIIRIGR